MKVSKKAKRLLSRILKNGGELIVNEYSTEHLVVLELLGLGLVEKTPPWKCPYLKRYENAYEITACDVLEDVEDVEYYSRSSKFKSQASCPACGGDHTMIECPNSDKF